MVEGEERLGELVGGRYELRGVLGQGGQSVIYRAKDQVDGDEVAIKIIKLGDRDGVDRLFREARALVALAGTAAVRVLHQTHTTDGAACLVTEILRGRDLDQYLQEMEEDGRRMAAPEIVSTFDPIVKTLEVAHERGIVHRDLKPGNIFIIHAAYGGGVRLLDFGFTRFVHARPLTAPGIVAGSPTYLAPEAWAGASNIDHRADVYALGVLLYRVLAGEPPFSGRIHELLKIVRQAPRPSLHALRPDLPKVLDEWVASALAVDREHRFQNVSALWNAFRTCLGQV
jgi:serine/threonine protein kinase